MTTPRQRFEALCALKASRFPLEHHEAFRRIELALSDLTAAEARIVELEELFNKCQAISNAYAARSYRAEAVADRLRPDALRYRWLRENAEDITWPTGQVCGLQFLIDGRARFDAVIDRELTGTPVADGGEAVWLVAGREVLAIPRESKKDAYATGWNDCLDEVHLKYLDAAADEGEQ